MAGIEINSGVINYGGVPLAGAGLLANRPAFGVTGRLYIGTDTNLIYRDTGTAWVSISGSGTITGSGTAGQAAFWTGSSVISGDNTFFWDNTNKRLGLGTATPGVRLDIHGATGTLVQINGTGASSSLIDFQSSGTTQWRFGYDTTSDFLFTNITAKLNPTFTLTAISTTAGYSVFNFSGASNYLQFRAGSTAAAGTFLGLPIANNVVFAGWPVDTLSNAFVIGINLANPDLVFSTANTERIRIKNTGIVNIANRTNIAGATDNANFELNVSGNTYTGGISPNISTFTTNTQMTRTGCGYYCTATLTLTLPTVAGLNNWYIVVAGAGATVTVQRNGTDTILDKTGASVTSVTVAAGTRSMFYVGGGTITFQIF